MNIGFLLIRAGSKGIPNKNIAVLAGKPLFYWILRAAQASNLQRIYVSSDSDLYLEKVKQYFPNINTIKRTEILASDACLEVDVLYSHISDLYNNGHINASDTIVRLHATSPLQTPEDINKTIQALHCQSKASSSALVKVAEIEPEKVLYISVDKDGQRLVSALDGTSESVTPVNRQRYRTSYQRANIITFYASTLLESKSLTGSWCIPVITNELRIDIDNAHDFFLASLVLENMLT